MLWTFLWVLEQNPRQRWFCSIFPANEMSLFWLFSWQPECRAEPVGRQLQVHHYVTGPIDTGWAKNRTVVGCL